MLSPMFTEVETRNETETKTGLSSRLGVRQGQDHCLAYQVVPSARSCEVGLSVTCHSVLASMGALDEHMLLITNENGWLSASMNQRGGKD